MTTPVETNAPVAEACPSCGAAGNVLFTVTLDYAVDGGYRADHFGVVPEQGDTITRCEHCAAFFVHADDGTALGAPAATSAPVDETPAETETSSSSTPDVAALEAKVAELEQQLAAAQATPPSTPAEQVPPPATATAPPWASGSDSSTN
jgi:hypothetical protein